MKKVHPTLKKKKLIQNGHTKQILTICKFSPFTSNPTKEVINFNNLVCVLSYFFAYRNTHKVFIYFNRTMLNILNEISLLFNMYKYTSLFNGYIAPMTHHSPSDAHLHFQFFHYKQSCFDHPCIHILFYLCFL